MQNSVSIFSSLIQYSFLHCHSNFFDLASSFTDVLKNFAIQSNAQMNLNFLQSQNPINIRLAPILETLNQRRGLCTVLVLERKRTLWKTAQHCFYICRKINSLICKTNSRDIAIHYESLGSTVRGTLSTLSRVFYYIFSQTNEILNQSHEKTN